MSVEWETSLKNFKWVSGGYGTRKGLTHYTSIMKYLEWMNVIYELQYSTWELWRHHSWMCVRVCLKFQDKSLIMKLKISWAANSLKTMIVFLQWTKRVPDLKLLKPISQKLVIIWKGDFSSKIWRIQITVDTVPIWVIKSWNYWHFLKCATFFNNKKRYLILNLSNSFSYSQTFSNQAFLSHHSIETVIVNDTSDLWVAKSKGLFLVLIFLDL